jgi:hypothetical protein
MARSCSTYDGEESFVQGFDGGDVRERDHWEGPGVDGKIILSCIFRKWDGGTWPGLIWLRIGAHGWLL